MKSKRRNRPANRRTVRNRCETASMSVSKRSGSSLLIVMVLMGMLTLLGVIFYTFAAQERSNAAYYSDAAKNLGDPSLTADTLFDWALEQIIVGTDRRLTNSMLWGSRHSLLSNALGVGYNSPGDLHPFNGEGVNLMYDSNGNIAVDQNRNGLPDDGTSGEKDYRYLLDYNDSPAAYKLFDSGERQVFNGSLYFPETDVGYTYPDINNVFLTYVGKVRDANGNIHQVVKPAYLVPGLLRSPVAGVSAPLTFEDTNFNGVLDTGEDTNNNGILDDWCVNPTNASRIMRPHPAHIYVPATGIPSNPSNRYLTDAQAVAAIGPSAHGFPFHPMSALYNTTTAAGATYNSGRMGVYSGINANPANDLPIEFDYDNDGDLINEAILMDLDFPPQQDASGNLFVPLFLITIHDLDALINLNVHGNLSKILYGPNDINLADTPLSNTGGNPFGFSNPVPPATPQFHFVSQSNLGLSPSEVNPLWALNSRYGVDTAAGSTLFSGNSQYSLFYGAQPQLLSAPNPVWGETANMEFAWSKIGRLKYSSGGTITDILPGTYGEEYLLYSAQANNSLATAGGHNLPRPGTSLLDDNGDLNEGQSDYSPYYQHPLDYTGLGTYVSTTNPKLLNWSTQVGQNQWITYSQYGNNSLLGSSSNIFWGQRPSTVAPLNSLFMTNSMTQGLGDDPNEISFYSPFPATDNVYTPDEMLYLNLSNSEIDRLNINSRLANLFPYNFSKNITDNPRGALIRKKFTTESNDRKSYGLPLSVRALGTAAIGMTVQTALNNSIHGQEYTLDTNTFTYKFPPQFGLPGNLVPTYSMTAVAPLGVDPIRPSTRSLLEIELNSQQSKNRVQRKLSVNQVLTGDLTYQLAFRDLTAHPADPGAAVISSVSGYTAYPPTTAAGEEYWARTDRQKMARDIYTLLYVLGHGDDSVSTASTANSAPSAITDGSTMYSDLQLREMAQFAVNLVDSMDRDSVITRFEYDKDLSDGWNLDDDPYGTPESAAYALGSANYNPTFPNDGASRGEVYGIERLDLTVSESLFIQAKKSQAATPTDYTQTNWNDQNGDHFFFFVELKNQGPMPITFDSHQAWQVVLRQEAVGANAAWERRLILKNNVTMDTLNNGASSNTSYVIGSADTSTTASGGIPAGSSFAVDPSWSGAPSVRIAPNRTGTPLDCDLDLIASPGTSGLYTIQDGAGTDLTATPGAMLSALSSTSPPNLTGATLKVLLRRRANPTRIATAPEADNPWVEVDSMMLQLNKGLKVFDMGTSPNAATAKAQLTQAASLERPQPLDGASQAISTGSSNAGTTFAYNTLGAINSLTPANTPTPPGSGPLYLWQLHFDRSFASLMDLLYVPVFGPHQLTALGRTAFADPPEIQESTVVTNPNWIVGPSPGTMYEVKSKSGASKFMVPEDPSNAGAALPVLALNNRWHRLLEVLEVPTRTNVNLGCRDGNDNSSSSRSDEHQHHAT